MNLAERNGLVAHVQRLRECIAGIEKAKSKALDDRSLHAISSWSLLDVSHDLLCMWVRTVEAELRFDLACDEAAKAGEIRFEDRISAMHQMATATPDDRVVQADAERRFPLVPPHVAQYAGDAA